MILYVPPLEEVKVLWFEGTLSEEDHRNFNLVYASLLLEGKAWNLTDLSFGMVLAEKPLAWLQVMHERLKHLIISSETLKEKKKAEYHAQANTKQISRGKGIGKHSNGIRYLGDSGKGKGKGKRPCGKRGKTKIAPCNITRKRQAPSSTIGIQGVDLFCLILGHVLVSMFHLCSTIVNLLMTTSHSVGMDTTSSKVEHVEYVFVIRNGMQDKDNAHQSRA